MFLQADCFSRAPRPYSSKPAEASATCMVAYHAPPAHQLNIDNCGHRTTNCDHRQPAGNVRTMSNFEKWFYILQGIGSVSLLAFAIFMIIKFKMSGIRRASFDNHEASPKPNNDYR